jgi:hypothetical protein
VLLERRIIIKICVWASIFQYELCSCIICHNVILSILTFHSLCVCVCARAYVRMGVHTCMCVHVQMHVCACALFIWVSAYVCTC